MDKTQREYILREQMKAIQKELGEDDPQRPRSASCASKVEAAGMPDEVKERALKEVERLGRHPQRLARGRASSAPTSTGWSPALERRTDDNLDLDEADAVLDEDHYGLEKVKERILEYMAVRKLAEQDAQPDPALRRPARRRQDVAWARASPARWAASSCA